jgi:surface antigen
MRAIPSIAAACALSLCLAACESGGPKEDAGLVVGAVAGGIIGSSVGRGTGRIVGAAVGATLGGIVGSEIGRALDEHDRRLAMEAELAALERGRSGVVMPWRNPDSGHYGEVIPREAFMRGPETCRDYEHRVFIDGRPQVMRGTACRNPDGTWRTVG